MDALPSPHRPPVAAAGHAQRARSYDQSGQGSDGPKLSIAPPTTDASLNWRAEFERLRGAFAASTIRSYISDVRLFAEWCSQKEVEAFPASVKCVCAFLEAQAPQLAPSTVRRRLYSIRKVHRLLRLPDPTWDEEIVISMRRIRRAKLGRPRQAKGLTKSYRDAFLAAQPNSPWGLRNQTMIALGYELLNAPLGTSGDPYRRTRFAHARTDPPLTDGLAPATSHRCAFQARSLPQRPLHWLRNG